MDPLLIPDVNEMIDKYVLMGQKLLNDNVQLNGYYLSNDIQNYYLKNMNITKETLTAVSTPWPKIVTHLKTLEQFILAIFPQHSGSNSKINNVNSNGGGMTGSNTGDNSEAEYDYRFDMNPPNEESTTVIHQIHSSHSISTLSSASTPILDNNNNINMGRRSGGGSSNNINNNNNGLGLITRLDGRKDMSFNMMNNIDKLFAERVDIYRSVDPSINSICGGLVRMVVKAFQETVRQLQGIDNILYQQLQLDIEFIQHTFWSYTTEEK